MKIILFKIPLPLTTEEYKVAQLWSVAETSRKETGGGSGVEILKNEPCEELMPNGKTATGYYTKKIYHTRDKVPGWIRKTAETIVGENALDLQEEAWNLFPYCRTVITHPRFQGFEIVIESQHMDDRGDNPSPENLCISNFLFLNGKPVSYSQLDKDCQFINIATDPSLCEDDPTKFRSEKSGRGPIPPVDKWWETFEEPMMCCYKLVRFNFNYMWLVQGQVEKYFMSEEHRLLNRLHKQLFCWMDKWYGLTMEDIRRLEQTVAEELKEELHRGEPKGYKPQETKPKK